MTLDDSVGIICGPGASITSLSACRLDAFDAAEFQSRFVIASFREMRGAGSAESFNQTKVWLELAAKADTCRPQLLTYIAPLRTTYIVLQCIAEAVADAPKQGTRRRGTSTCDQYGIARHEETMLTAPG